MHSYLVISDAFIFISDASVFSYLRYTHIKKKKQQRTTAPNAAGKKVRLYLPVRG